MLAQSFRIVILSYFAFYVSACSEKNAAIPDPENTDQPAYSVFISERGDVHDIIPARGIFELRKQVEVGSEVSGRVIKLHVHPDSKVKKGQVLAELDPEPFIVALRQSEASLSIKQANIDMLRVNLEKLENQYGRRIKHTDYLDESREFMDNLAHDIQALKAQIRGAEAQLKQAKANLHLRKFDLAKTKIRSPMDGFVLEQNIEEGNAINAAFKSPKLFVIGDDRADMQITAEVSELDIARLRKGMMVRIKPASDNNSTMLGTLKKVESAPIKKGSFVNFKTITAPYGNMVPEYIKPGMSASMEFIGANLTDVPRIPIKALYSFPKEYMPALDSLGLKEEDIPISFKSGAGRFGYLNGVEIDQVHRLNKRRVFALEDGKIKMYPIRIIGQSEDFVAYDEADMPIGTPVIVGKKANK